MLVYGSRDMGKNYSKTNTSTLIGNGDKKALSSVEDPVVKSTSNSNHGIDQMKNPDPIILTFKILNAYSI
jgi:hypothetical protein